MLAIMGALILLDRMTGYFFDIFVVLIIPIVIIMYSSMNSLKDGAILSVGVCIMAFLLCNMNFIYLIYVPVGIFNGLAYSYGVIHDFDRRKLMLVSIVTYAIGELIATYIVYPLLGFPVSQMISEFMASMDETSGIMGINFSEMFSLAGLDLSKLIVVLYVISTILMGLMEGILIHLLSVFLLRRFKVKDLGKTNIFDIKPNPVLCYISFACMFLMYFTRNAENEIIYYGGTIFSIVGAMVLLYYGYIFMVLFSMIILRRNIAGFFVIMMFFIPTLMVLLLMVGFLYGTGPLRVYLEDKINSMEQK